MRILKVLLWIILALAGLVVVLALLGPKEEEFEKSIVIDAPKEVVYEYINSLEDMAKWSPWHHIDPDLEYEFKGQEGTVGSEYIWDSKNDSVGAGVQTITAVEGQEKVTTEIKFTRPQQSEGKAWVRVEEADKGKTEVFWGFYAEAPFFFRPVLLFFSFEEMLSADYQKGLSMLKDWVEKDQKKLKNIKEIMFPGGTFLVKKGKTSFADLSSFFDQSYTALGTQFKDRGITPLGGAYAFYYTWDTAAQETELSVGFPVSPSTLPAQGFELLELPQSPALVYSHKGGYSGLEMAHYAIDSYANQKNLILGEPAIEYYKIDQTQEPDSSKWITDIIYLQNQ